MWAARRVFLIFILFFMPFVAWGLDEISYKLVGENIYNCAREVYGLNNSAELNQDHILDFFKVISKKNLEIQSFFMEPLSDLERALHHKVKSMSPPIVTRTSLENLKKILAAEGLHSPSFSSEVKCTITPDFENHLFGAFGCVFVTVAPYDGTERYGEVIIKFRDAVRAKSWGSPWSGNYFLLNHRNIAKDALYETQKFYQNKVEKNDVFMHYLNNITVGEDWNLALANQAVMYLRNSRDKEELELRSKEAIKLIDENDEKIFWDTFINSTHCFGYIEGKVINYLPLSSIKSIKVPKARLAEVLGSPGAQRVKNLISTY
jgi:hypothetical protein